MQPRFSEAGQRRIRFAKIAVCPMRWSVSHHSRFKDFLVLWLERYPAVIHLEPQKLQLSVSSHTSVDHLTLTIINLSASLSVRHLSSESKAFQVPDHPLFSFLFSLPIFSPYFMSKLWYWHLDFVLFPSSNCKLSCLALWRTEAVIMSRSRLYLLQPSLE